MATFVFGPINGDFTTLKSAFEQLDIDNQTDRIWFAGNVLGEGDDNLPVLEFIKALEKQATLVLGQHEIQFMAMAENVLPPTQHQSLASLLASENCGAWSRWLASRPLLHHENEYTLVNAGLPVEWSLSQARTHAIEAESSLSMGNRKVFFENIINEPSPSRWHAKLRGWKRTRFIVNALTKMTYIDENERFDFKQSPNLVTFDENLSPWYQRSEKVLAGHKVITAYALGSDQVIPDNVITLQGPDEGHVLKVLKLADHAEMYSFLRG